MGEARTGATAARRQVNNVRYNANGAVYFRLILKKHTRICNADFSCFYWSFMRLEGRQSLTPREEQVLKLIVAGAKSKEIALALGISFKTVVTHRTHIMSKLACHTVAELVRCAMRCSLVDTPVEEEGPLYEQLRQAQREYMHASRDAVEFLKDSESMGTGNPDGREGARLHHNAEHFAYEKYATLLKQFSAAVLSKKTSGV
jgi:DNA-binding CsgD family transcriptional regulator